MNDCENNGPGNICSRRPDKQLGCDQMAQADMAPVQPEHHLGCFSTSALILNKIIGTGIFVSPSIVLAAAGSKGVSLILWLVGCIVTWAGLMLYLEYGIRWPRNGGELYYIRNVYEKPRNLFMYIFSISFVLLGGVQPNALTFGKEVIIASSPPGTTIDPRLQKLFAVLIITFVCQFQAFSRLMNIRVNNALAAFKVALLLFIAVTGLAAIAGKRTAAAAATGSTYGKENLTNLFAGTGGHPYGYSLALLNVVRAFSGYENANYVLEEVRRPPKDPNSTFRNAVRISVMAICFLYFMVNVAFFAACSSQDILDSPETLELFFTNVFGPSAGARRASSIVISLSACGNIMSMTFANVRVKQEIARLGLIPIPHFWARTSHRGTPAPAILLHWFFSVLVVLVTPLHHGNGYLIVITLYAYVHTFISVFLGCNLLCAPFLKAFGSEEDGDPWKPESTRLGCFLLVPLLTIYVVAHLFIIALSWCPASVQDTLRTKAHTLPSFTGPLAGVLILAAGALFWAWDFRILPLLGYHFGPPVEKVEDRKTTVYYPRSTSGFSKWCARKTKPMTTWLSENIWETRGPNSRL